MSHGRSLRHWPVAFWRPEPVFLFILAPGHGAVKEGRRREAMTENSHGLKHGLTNYGDPDFSLYLRRSFAQSTGYSRAALEKPVVGIAYTPSGFNNCHPHFTELLETGKPGVLAV